jgi:hypothetical protein
MFLRNVVAILPYNTVSPLRKRECNKRCILSLITTFPSAGASDVHFVMSLHRADVTLLDSNKRRRKDVTCPSVRK